MYTAFVVKPGARVAFDCGGHLATGVVADKPPTQPDGTDRWAWEVNLQMGVPVRVLQEDLFDEAEILEIMKQRSCAAAS